MVRPEVDLVRVVPEVDHAKVVQRAVQNLAAGKIEAIFFRIYLIFIFHFFFLSEVAQLALVRAPIKMHVNRFLFKVHLQQQFYHILFSNLTNLWIHFS